jgi:hypothetical protein
MGVIRPAKWLARTRKVIRLIMTSSSRILICEECSFLNRTNFIILFDSCHRSVTMPERGTMERELRAELCKFVYKHYVCLLLARN